MVQACKVCYQVWAERQEKHSSCLRESVSQYLLFLVTTFTAFNKSSVYLDEFTKNTTINIHTFTFKLFYFKHTKSTYKSICRPDPQLKPSTETTRATRHRGPPRPLFRESVIPGVYESGSPALYCSYPESGSPALYCSYPDQDYGTKIVCLVNHVRSVTSTGVAFRITTHTHTHTNTCVCMRHQVVCLINHSSLVSSQKTQESSFWRVPVA